MTTSRPGGGPGSSTCCARSRRRSARSPFMPADSVERQRITRLRPVVLAGALVLLLAVLLGSVLLGAVDLGTGRVLGEGWAELTGGPSPLSVQESAILWQLRVPRVVLGALVGAALASSGAAYQGVFRNPLADPYLLGAAAGAGMVTTIGVGLC